MRRQRSALAGDEAAPEALRGIARMRGALLALDQGNLDGAKERAAPLNVPGNPWRHAAREVLGMAAYQAGDLQGAREYFVEIQQDAQTPSDLWARSGMMMSLIDGQLATAADNEANSAGNAPEAEAVEAEAEAPAPSTLPVPAEETPVPSEAASEQESEPETQEPIPPQ
jgi:hypothetical protein